MIFDYDNNPDQVDQQVILEFLENNPGIAEQLEETKKPPQKNVIKKNNMPLNKKQRTELLEIAYKTNFRHGLMIEVQMFTGLRVNELINLTAKDLDFKNRYIRVQSHKATHDVKAFKTKTLSSNRNIPVCAALMDRLYANIGSTKTGYVFESQKARNEPKPFLKNSVIGFINQYANKCPSIGKNIGSHCLRRTYASYLMSQKLQISDISKLLGHSSVKTTMIYLFSIEQVDDKQVRLALNKMNKGGKR